MARLANRDWVPTASEELIQNIAGLTAGATTPEILDRLDHLADANRSIHETECFNLNPATNVMNPRAERLLSSGLGTRPSLGYPGDKYEMGLEAIEEIEVIAAELSAEIFAADFAEIRVPSGAVANLYAFMATCNPGDAIITPPAEIAGHVTHHEPGAAGLYGLQIYAAPVAADGYTVDIAALDQLADEVRPKLITIGGSLNLSPHPVAEIRSIADGHRAKLLFDAAHQCGIIAGGVWPNPLHEGAHLMTMSTYKSLGGPPGGLIVTNDAELAKRLDGIAFPGLTANFDVAKSAALAVTMLDWREHGAAYAQAMVDTSRVLAQELANLGVPMFSTGRAFTASHQFAVEAARYGGGQAASKHLRKAGFLACGIGLPLDPVLDDLNGLRLGTPELVRWGMTVDDMPRLASLITGALDTDEPERLATEVAAWRQEFTEIHYVCG